MPPLQGYAEALIRSEEEAAQEQTMRITRAAANVAAAGGLGADGAGSMDLLPAALVEAGPLPPPPAPKMRPLPPPVRRFKPTEDDGLLVELLEVRYPLSNCSRADRVCLLSFCRAAAAAAHPRCLLPPWDHHIVVFFVVMACAYGSDAARGCLLSLSIPCSRSSRSPRGASSSRAPTPPRARRRRSAPPSQAPPRAPTASCAPSAALSGAKLHPRLTSVPSFATSFPPPPPEVVV